MRDVLNPWANPVTWAVPFFLLFIGIELAALKWLDHDDVTGYQPKDASTSILMGLGSLATTLAFKAAAFFVYIALYLYVAPWHLPMRTWWSWVLVIGGVDFAYYWQHRFVHRARVGWAAHQAHHSSEYMNFGTALRQKWNPWFEFFFWLPLPLLGVAPWAIYFGYGINLVYQFFVHTETIKKLPRPFEFLFNTPSHHRVHHGADPIYLDRNYAGILDHLGPHVRHLPARALPAEVRPGPPGGLVQPHHAGVRPLRRAVAGRPRRLVVARPARLPVHAAGLAAGVGPHG